ncbi:protein of unknown function [Blastococcus saxobsidens DD2]|uniref:Uncharacterized protein n=1 Tax=Blastococcus saxobsidens (strain DD2) TaxID=1146883 RepID=H6RNR0_BLASD|nr:protein of unknown function [Blastococcus saxobsidens DD2]
MARRLRRSVADRVGEGGRSGAMRGVAELPDQSCGVGRRGRPSADRSGAGSRAGHPWDPPWPAPLEKDAEGGRRVKLETFETNSVAPPSPTRCQRRTLGGR